MAHLPLGFTFYKDNPTADQIQKRRKLSIGSNGSDSTGEKQELNESFNRLNLGVLSASADFQRQTQMSVQSQNLQLTYPKPIRPSFLKPQDQQQQSLLMGIQKYLRLDNDTSEANVSDILQQPYQQLQKFMDATRIDNIKCEDDQVQSQNNKFRPLGKYIYGFGMPSNFETLIEQTKSILQSEMEDETERQRKEQEETHLEALLSKSNPGKLSKEQRAEKVRLYLEKKKIRQWKQVRYSVRKSLADQRERQQGRFVKSSKPRFNQSLIQLTQSDTKKDEKGERKLNSLTNSQDFNISA